MAMTLLGKSGGWWLVSKASSQYCRCFPWSSPYYIRRSFWTFTSKFPNRFPVLLPLKKSKLGRPLMSAHMSKDVKQETMSMRTNRLANEKSPYLLQHANNPVDWYPWSEEAFGKAKEENKPIFLSVGYSTCHWCHVMEKESFENEQIASILNTYFVSVKATNGNGGTTYLPPDRFASALQQIAEKWRTSKEAIEQEGSRVLNALQQYLDAPRKDDSLNITTSCLEQGYMEAKEMFDEEYGGFGTAPKFPRPVVYDFLFTLYWFDGGKTERAKDCLNMALQTLSNMAKGGIHDHLGGGFHRYSVDQYWHVPHFEKMLYDQSQLLQSYLDAYLITKDESFRDTAIDILSYVLRDMTDKNTAILNRFIIYQLRKLKKKLISEHFDIKPEGNARPGSDPFGELGGKNVLYIAKSLTEVSKSMGVSEAEANVAIQEAKQKLWEQRNRRARPHLDDKIITSWNAMMIYSLVKAYIVLEDEQYLQKAMDAATFLKSYMIETTSQETTLIYRSYREGRSDVEGFVEDYAHTIRAFLSVFEATGNEEWLKYAIQLQNTQDATFYDEVNGGYFSTSSQAKNILLRRKDDYDGSEPSPSAVSGWNLFRLGAITGDTKYYEKFKSTINAFSIPVNKAPFGVPAMLINCCLLLKEATRVVLVVDNMKEPRTRDLVNAVVSRFEPNRVLIPLKPDNQRFLSSLSTELKAMKMIEDSPTAYVCFGKTCKNPVTSKEELCALLDSEK
ncbi:Spermatogenesis-associated protein 20 [Galdieria sulphuraria]|nr:Spermatogenesis-associated protein 20 [Galdieria sulphuraria]